MHIYNVGMTLRLRNSILIMLSLLSVLCLAAAVYGTIDRWDKIDLQTAAALVPIAVLILFSTVAEILIFLSFRNTASAEIFFFFIFLFSFLFDAFRIVIMILPETNLPFTIGMISTRIVYFGKFLGAMAVFSSGLFSSGLEYQRMGIVFLVNIILSAALVWLLPVDISTTVPGGIWELGKFLETSIAIGFLELTAIINYLIAGRKNENREYVLLAAALLAVLAGRELLFFLTGFIASAAGALLLIAGTIIFGLRTHRLYLWE